MLPATDTRRWVSVTSTKTLFWADFQGTGFRPAQFSHRGARGLRSTVLSALRIHRASPSDFTRCLQTLCQERGYFFEDASPIIGHVKLAESIFSRFSNALRKGATVLPAIQLHGEIIRFARCILYYRRILCSPGGSPTTAIPPLRSYQNPLKRPLIAPFLLSRNALDPEATQKCFWTASWISIRVTASFLAS